MAASVKRVRTSQATSSSTARRRAGARIARIAPKPPSVVADPPRPTMIRLAPASSAASISSPVPVVLAAIGSLPSAPPASTRPDASAISITAVRPVIRQSASTGSPSGTGHDRVPGRAAEGVEPSLSAVGDRRRIALVAEPFRRRGDRAGDLACRRRAPELVHGCEHTHERAGYWRSRAPKPVLCRS